LDLSNITTAADRIVFASAAAKWESVVVGDLESYANSSFPTRNDGCQWPAVVDDLFICAKYGVFDGLANFLGLGGPDYVRLPSGLPITGNMVFDIDDIANMRSNGGQLQSLILHEMGHVLGTSHFAASVAFAMQELYSPLLTVNLNMLQALGCNGTSLALLLRLPIAITLVSMPIENFQRYPVVAPFLWKEILVPARPVHIGMKRVWGENS
jgi:hypothetical protein